MWTNYIEDALYKKANLISFLDHHKSHLRDIKSEFFALLGYLALFPYALCLEGQVVDALANFWMEFLQLGFYLMVSW